MMMKLTRLTMALVAVSLLAPVGSFSGPRSADAAERPFTRNFPRCTLTPTGRNRYMILEPGYQLVLEGDDDGTAVRLVITVLDQTEMVGDVETRIVEERETEDGELSEVSQNFFAFCAENASFFYFGEQVDFYENGQVVNHDGSWRADEGGAKFGLQMAGLPLYGARYFQEFAPDVAEDRAEIVSLKEVVETPAGRFRGCLKTRETTLLEPDLKEFKFYAPGVGLIKDGELELVSSGNVN
jgi:hypothetical protein